VLSNSSQDKGAGEQGFGALDIVQAKKEIRRTLEAEGMDPEIAKNHAELLARSRDIADFEERFKKTDHVLRITLGGLGYPPEEIDSEVSQAKSKILGILKEQSNKQKMRMGIASDSLKELVERAEKIKITDREKLAHSIAEEILNKHVIRTFYVSSSSDQSEIGIYCFDGISYRPCEKEIKREIGELASSLSKEINEKTTRWIENEVLAKIRLFTLRELKYDSSVIGFENTIFDWEAFLESGDIAKSVIQPGPEVIAFHRIPHRLAYEKVQGKTWNSIEEMANELCPKTLKAFKDWVGDKWILLFEIIGYALYPKYSLNKAIMLVGEGDNGKSTYLRLVGDILGSENISHIPLQKLTDQEQRFYTVQLYHKLANIFADLPKGALEDTGTFKVLTGEDAVYGEIKRGPVFYFYNYAKLLFSANELPAVYDMTHAFWRRWIVIEFPNTFPQNPNFYSETFTEEEKEGAILVSLIAIREVLRRAKFSFEETAADYKEIWLRKTDSVYAFNQDMFEGKLIDSLGYKAEKDENAKVEAGFYYQLYVKYCDIEDREAIAKKDFTLRLERIGFKKIKIRGEFYYKGIRLIEVKPSGRNSLTNFTDKGSGEAEGSEPSESGELGQYE